MEIIVKKRTIDLKSIRPFGRFLGIELLVDVSKMKWQDKERRLNFAIKVYNELIDSSKYQRERKRRR